MKRCFACTGARPLHECTGCNVAVYCNTACQRAGWKEHGHSTNCGVLASRVALGLWRQWTPMGGRFAPEDLQDLPPEIVASIYGYLPAADVRSLMATSTKFRADLGPRIWHALLHRDIPAYLFDKRELPDGSTAMRPVFEQHDYRMLVKYEDRAHPELRALLDEVAASDWRTTDGETLSLLYDRIMRCSARAMDTEFCNAVAFVRKIPKPGEFGKQMTPPGLDRMGYIGMVHYDGSIANPKELDSTLSKETTLWRLFQPNPASLGFLPSLKDVGLPVGIQKRLSVLRTSEPFNAFVTALADGEARKEDIWKPAYNWIVHVLQKIEPTATLALTDKYGRKYSSSHENGIFVYRMFEYPDRKVHGDRNWVGNLGTAYRPYVRNIFLGLATGNTRTDYY